MVWLGSYAGLCCCGVDAIGDMWAFLLWLFVVVVSFAFVEYFLFPQAALCLFVTRPFVMGLRERGRRGMCVYGCGARCCVSVLVYTVLFVCEAVWIMGWGRCVISFPWVEGARCPMGVWCSLR
jgi:hypothetical protein